MDEPTIGLDPAGAQELRQLIPSLVKRGKTILLTTHYMSEADELSQQLAIISRGRVIATGTPSTIKRSFAKIAVCEIICWQTQTNVVETMQTLPGFQRVTAIADSPIQRITIQMKPNTQFKAGVTEIIGKGNIESMVMRDPTLEEAYLSIIK